MSSRLSTTAEMVATQINDGFFLSTASSFIPARNPDGVTDWRGEKKTKRYRRAQTRVEPTHTDADQDK